MNETLIDFGVDNFLLKFELTFFNEFDKNDAPIILLNSSYQ